MEERAGERRLVVGLEMKRPLSSILSPLLRRGERKMTLRVAEFIAARDNSDR
jgi:hypothetical protein